MGSKGLERREFLKLSTIATAGAVSGRLMAAARVDAAGRAKITDVKLVGLRVEKDLGSYPDWVGNPRHVAIGGGAFTEVRTDQGVTGIGPQMDPSLLPQVNAVLAGQDPFDINLLATRLYDVRGNAGYRGTAAAEIAVWDLIGKLAGQPLYKLWGGGRERIIPYASMLRLSTPEERGEQAAKMKADGWRAIKVRSSFPTLREDVQLVEAIRKTTGDDWVIMCDANKAPMDQATTKGVRWDFTRACQTALEYQRLNVYWLEEPLPRYDYDQLAELNRMIHMKLAGGEGNREIHEFRDLLEKGVFDIVQPEVMMEGPTHLRMISAMAQSMYKMCIPHVGDMRLGTVCDLHLIASWPEANSPYIEIFNDQPIGNYTYPFSIFENPPVLTKDGYFDLPQGPGLGMKIREDLILKS
jgi:L-alanine-DL-glutamate epimerase-like enolase superfamily enzyme